MVKENRDYTREDFFTRSAQETRPPFVSLRSLIRFTKPDVIERGFLEILANHGQGPDGARVPK
eukprot:gene12242-biopygen3343